MKEPVLVVACSVIRKGLDLSQRAASVPTMLTLLLYLIYIFLLLYFAQTSVQSQLQETDLKQTRTIFPAF